MELLYKPANEIVFDIDSYGDKFYLILYVNIHQISNKIFQGEVSVHIRLPGTTGMNLQQVAILKKGNGFGQVALINNAPRLARIVSQTKSFFIFLSRKSKEIQILDLKFIEIIYYTLKIIIIYKSKIIQLMTNRI